MKSFKSSQILINKFCACIHYLLIATVVLFDIAITQTMEVKESHKLDSVKIFFLQNKTLKDILLQIKQNNGSTITRIQSENCPIKTINEYNWNSELIVLHNLRSQQNGYLIFFSDDNSIFPFNINLLNPGSPCEAILKSKIDVADDRKTIVFEEKPVKMPINQISYVTDIVVSVKSSDGNAKVRSFPKSLSFMPYENPLYYDENEDALIFRLKNP